MKPKLVRDLIPEIIKANGQTAKISIADEKELIDLLKDKLVEEALEVQAADNQKELEEELADVVQVIYSICDRLSIDFNNIEKQMKDKVKKRGEFKKGYVLEDVK